MHYTYSARAFYLQCKSCLTWWSITSTALALQFSIHVGNKATVTGGKPGLIYSLSFLLLMITSCSCDKPPTWQAIHVKCCPCDKPPMWRVANVTSHRCDKLSIMTSCRCDKLSIMTSCQCDKLSIMTSCQCDKLSIMTSWLCDKLSAMTSYQCDKSSFVSTTGERPKGQAWVTGLVNNVVTYFHCL